MLDEFLFSQYFISQNGYKIIKLYYITATLILPAQKTPKPYRLSVLKISSFYIIKAPWTYSASKVYHPYPKFPSLFWHFPIPTSSEVPFLHPQESYMGIHIKRHSYIRMSHQILQCFRIHARLCHIGTICMSANMRSNIGHPLYRYPHTLFFP